MADHAKLSPSAAARWLTCTAAPAIEANYPEQSSDYASEGTFAHELAELETGYSVGNYKKSEYNKKLKVLQKDPWYSAEMHEYINDYSSYIKEAFLSEKETCEDAFVELEVKLDLTEYVPEGFGTADCVIISDGTMNIVDLKYGKGVAVQAEDNPQMKLYALGAYELYSSLYSVEQVKMTIVQPRLGGISSAEISAAELVQWGETTVKPLAKKAFEGEGEFNPSEHACRFCKAAGDCRARAEYFTNLFFENENTEILSADEAGKILMEAKDMENWLKALREKVFEHLVNGETVEGWKLVAGKTNRKYTDDEKVAEALIDEGYEEDVIYTKKVIGISSVEKLLGKKRAAEVLGNLVYKPEGSPSLAEESDKRPEISVKENIVKAFDEE